MTIDDTTWFYLANARDIRGQTDYAFLRYGNWARHPDADEISKYLANAICAGDTRPWDWGKIVNKEKSGIRVNKNR